VDRIVLWCIAATVLAAGRGRSCCRRHRCPVELPPRVFLDVDGRGGTCVQCESNAPSEANCRTAAQSGMRIQQQPVTRTPSHGRFVQRPPRPTVVLVESRYTSDKARVKPSPSIVAAHTTAATTAVAVSAAAVCPRVAVHVSTQLSYAGR
jgi:hypothetical protein